MYFAGALYHVWQSYTLPFYLGAGVSILAAVLMLPVHWLQKTLTPLVIDDEIVENGTTENETTKYDGHCERNGNCIE
jgi:hypothetical protein